MSKNQNLHNAKNAKNDEFYTQLADIENELKHYYGELYITSTGNKYHEKDCIFVKHKDNVERLKIEQFENGEYEPCDICLPHGSQ